jgi:xanthine dehydrogenase/oxidase
MSQTGFPSERVLFSDKLLAVNNVVLTFGAIAPYPWRASKTEQLIGSQPLSLGDYPKIAKVLAKEVKSELKKVKPRMAGLMDEGFTDEYKIELAVSFVYKSMVNALMQVAPDSVPEDVRSSGEITWGRWPVSDGSQYYSKKTSYRAPVSIPYVKLMALYQTSGQVRYTHEMEVPPTTLNASFVQSKKALADFCYKNPESGDYPITKEQLCEQLKKTFPEFIELITCDNIPPGGMNDAIKMGSIFPDWPSTAPFYNHIWKITRHNSDFGWTTKDKKPLDKEIVQRKAVVDGGSCQVIESTQTSGGQVHFYMETQSCVALPTEAQRMTLHPSSQSPLEMHQTAAGVLGVEHNQVEIDIRQVGGGYGGKTEQTKFVVGAAAVAAKTMDKPVRLVMPRDNDTSMIGKRHPYYGQYQIAIDDGGNNPDHKGLMPLVWTLMMLGKRTFISGVT